MPTPQEVKDAWENAKESIDSGDYEAAVENFVAVDIDVAAIETSVLVLRDIFVDLWRYDVAAAAVVTSG